MVGEGAGRPRGRTVKPQTGGLKLEHAGTGKEEGGPGLPGAPATRTQTRVGTSRGLTYRTPGRGREMAVGEDTQPQSPSAHRTERLSMVDHFSSEVGVSHESLPGVATRTDVL